MREGGRPPSASPRFVESHADGGAAGRARQHGVRCQLGPLVLPVCWTQATLARRIREAHAYHLGRHWRESPADSKPSRTYEIAGGVGRLRAQLSVLDTGGTIAADLGDGESCSERDNQARHRELRRTPSRRRPAASGANAVERCWHCRAQLDHRAGASVLGSQPTSRRSRWGRGRD